MVNTEEFIQRMEQILQFYGLSASAFADRVGVQRSSLSHLLSGRNKPSLDFVMKICDEFSEVDLYWFLQGKGQFPKSGNQTAPTHLFQQTSDDDTQKQETPSLASSIPDVRTFEDLKSEVLNPSSIEKSDENSQETIHHESIEKNIPKSQTESSNQQNNELDASYLQKQITFSGNEVDQVVVFFKDGTFKAYRPRN